MNEAIRAPELRVIDQDGKQIGVVSRTEAINSAKEQGLDLVEISPGASPPVAKIVDWGKFNYQRTKQLQKTKKRSLEIKQMRIGLKISEHDLEVKLNKIKSFLEIGHKVKVMIIYRGRELAHRDVGFKLADKVVGLLGEQTIVEQPPQFAGKQISLVIRSKSNAKA